MSNRLIDTWMKYVQLDEFSQNEHTHVNHHPGLVLSLSLTYGYYPLPQLETLS